jgi:hypothetical protein
MSVLAITSTLNKEGDLDICHFTTLEDSNPPDAGERRGIGFILSETKKNPAF